MNATQNCSHWICCPACGGKTRIKVYEDTALERFPLHCHKCKQENANQCPTTECVHHRARRTDAEPVTYGNLSYSAIFAALDTLIAAGLSQMELYCGIGRLVSNRSEKGAAVAAAEYLCAAYPDVSGFSPRNLHRMRKFYRAYESVPEVLAQAMTIGRTQNVVIPEVELTLQEQAWYIRAVRQFGWTKLELQRKIAAGTHLEIAIDFTGKTGPGRQPRCAPAVPQRQGLSVHYSCVPRQAGRGRDNTEYVPGRQAYRQRAYGRLLGYSQAGALL